VGNAKSSAQSVGALLPHHSAQSYDSGLAQEKELCIQSVMKIDENRISIFPKVKTTTER
jgi:hypothetical protein